MTITTKIPVIPAQAGIHTGWPCGSITNAAVMDSRLRGNDGCGRYV